MTFREIIDREEQTVPKWLNGYVYKVAYDLMTQTMQFAAHIPVAKSSSLSPKNSEH